jgi:hypothetical protein
MPSLMSTTSCWFGHVPGQWLFGLLVERLAQAVHRIADAGATAQAFGVSARSIWLIIRLSCVISAVNAARPALVKATQVRARLPS